MGFSSNPLSFPEGPSDKNVRVDPIERSRKGKDSLAGPLQNEKVNLPKYAFFYLIMRKQLFILLRHPPSSDRRSTGKIENRLTAELRIFYRALQRLTQKDESERASFLQHLTQSWRKIGRLLKRIPVGFSGIRIHISELERLLEEIGAYPPHEKEYPFSYYLSKEISEEWLPMPLREVVKNLHLDHQTQGEHSTLSRWIRGIRKACRKWIV